MEFERVLDLAQLLQKKSHFLLGPRATGKSYLIKKNLSQKAHIIDLLESETYMDLLHNPGKLETLIPPGKKWVVIDEIQKIPLLLNEVHRLIEKEKIRFLLTGSSARKLKANATNLLGGRARKSEIFPLCFPEMKNFNLEGVLQYGSLPMVVQSSEPQLELKDYAQIYLREEIQAEGIVRKLPQFSKFLESAAISNGQILNFAKIGSDAQSAPSTVREHYSILEDTLIGFQIFPYTKTKNRRAIMSSKFYFFDLGVVHTLSGTKHLDRNSDLYGRSFEHWIALELRAYLSYRSIDEPLQFWKSTHQQEVDFLVGEQLAIEVKSTRNLQSSDFKSLKLLKEEKKIKNFLMVSQDQRTEQFDGIRCLHWKSFMDLLWGDKLF